MFVSNVAGEGLAIFQGYNWGIVTMVRMLRSASAGIRIILLGAIHKKK